MSQLAITAVLTNGSATVTVPGENLTGVVHAGYVLAVVGEAICYSIATEPSYSAPDTILTLSANYAGTSGTKSARIVLDYTYPDSIPLIKPGDLDTARIFTEAMLRIQELLTTYGLSVGGSPLLDTNNLSDLTDVPAARTALGLSAAAVMTPSAIVSTALTSAMITAALGAAAWTSANDGNGSGLDADLLDGLEATYFRNASNIDAGILAPARMGTGTADSTKVLYGDGTWRTVADGGIGLTPVDKAGDTMNGDLGFASGKKIAFPDEWGTKLQLKGADAIVEAVESTTTIDFNHGGGLTGWRFMAGVDERLQITEAGLRIGGNTTLRSPALGVLQLHDGALAHTLGLYHFFSGGGVDNEGLEIATSDGGASIFSVAAGTGTPRSMALGTKGDAEVVVFTNSAARWSFTSAGHFVPVIDNVTDLGEAATRIKNVYLKGQILSTSLGTPVLSTPDDPDTGVALPADGQIDMMVDGSTVARFTAGGLELAEELGVKFNNALLELKSVEPGRLAFVPTATGGNNPRIKLYRTAALTDDQHVYLGYNDAGTAGVLRAQSTDGGLNTFPMVVYGSQVDLTTPDGGWTVGTGGHLIPSANTNDIGSVAVPLRDIHIGGMLMHASEVYVNGARAMHFVTDHDNVGVVSPYMLGLRSGRKLFADENFDTGVNSVTAYHTGGGSVALNRINTVGNPPNSSGYVLEITQTWPSSGAHVGGFQLATTPRGNAVFLQQFVARAPVGYDFDVVSVDLDTDGKMMMVGPTKGTGKWETYSALWMCGSTPVDDAGVIQLTGGDPDEVLVWHVASCTVLDLTDKTIDADLLNGHDTSYFTNASNLSSGIVAPARLGTGTADSTKALFGDGVWRAITVPLYFGETAPTGDEQFWWNTADGNLRVLYDDGDTVQWVDANHAIKGDKGDSGVAPSGTGFVRVTSGVLDTPSGLTSGEITTGLGFTPVTNARTVSAGSGLSGGGDLTANRTLSLDLASANVWTAMQTFRAGATGAGTAPFKLQSGALNTTAEAGAFEFLTDKIYFTITTGAARKEVALNDGGLTATRIPYVTTNGRLTDVANLVWDNANSALLLGAQSFNAGYYFENSQSSNGNVSIRNTNRSTGAAAYGGFYAFNSGANAAALVKIGTGYTTSGLFSADDQLLQGQGGKLVIANLSSADIVLATGGSATTNERLRVDSNGNVSIGNAALATNATNGFLYIPTCAGAPSGTPTAKTGRVAMIYDTTNNNLYVYNGAWKKTTTFA